MARRPTGYAHAASTIGSGAATKLEKPLAAVAPHQPRMRRLAFCAASGWIDPHRRVTKWTATIVASVAGLVRTPAWTV
jgi:hypothetical protein